MVKKYRTIILPEAINDIKRLDKTIAQRIINKVHWLQDNFESVVPEMLAGEFKEYFKLRAGDWRAIYTVDPSEKIITVYMVDHRSRVYKR